MSFAETSVNPQRWTPKRVTLLLVLPALAASAVLSAAFLPLTRSPQDHATLKNIYGVTDASWSKFGGMDVTIPNGTRKHCEDPSSQQLAERITIQCADGITLAPSR